MYTDFWKQLSNKCKLYGLTCCQQMQSIIIRAYIINSEQDAKKGKHLLCNKS